MEILELKNKLDGLRKTLEVAANGHDLRQLSLEQAFKTLNFNAKRLMKIEDRSERFDANFESTENRVLFEHAGFLSSTSSSKSTSSPPTDATTAMNYALWDAFAVNCFAFEKWRESELGYVVMATLSDPKIRNLSHF
ncbi:uncharacterized protein PHALS_11735 [Plasmopara halstedii]|uniref:Uncharacterized protein n=1 Tax=Plasmopara halstedii TaxID=4781 RepID=A0A0P1AJX9_PLAHL|nr:uncharacterized protein PHALS_11735 [Plasmopara halstedii]CEG41385.1 hypothetical protein PHALS_11735 [Plasmopara halstedii]|eukprot:XP_024577754.1 hypothetical protein PHALS_11735 [Plasmopara halstedii]